MKVLNILAILFKNGKIIIAVVYIIDYWELSVNLIFLANKNILKSKSLRNFDIVKELEKYFNYYTNN